ncbi:DNA-directed RNA polymerase II subunit [Penicillium canariense]|uniref:DNA-directed RNA polymerase II subunit n=1 Tax=Penicillium canariense TaxID=189055 RepID=A0A9W9LMH9_9EURO|nr:DNA-directed RNA polymerase II subunit [Penicillium canariense]KAJ5166602.1 DNA-directed RNA polymerase II subunit [Penicillium canariense]
MSSPVLSPASSKRPPKLPPKDLLEAEIYIPGIMMPFSSNFNFTTAAEAIAKDRAGRRGVLPTSHREGPRQVDDRPDVYEAILLAPGENKIDVEVDTRLPSAAIFTFHKEDHTLANMLRTRLLKTAHVIFAAYRVPHPLTPNFQLRVQTDGEVTPRDAVVNACQALIKDLGILSREFTKEYELRKMANAANQQQNIGE